MEEKRFLHLFDFDGTLVRSPSNSPQNQKLYEKETGIPWLIDKNLSRQLTAKHGKFVGMRSGWWGRAETLEPPLVPNPTPQELFITEVIQEFRKSRLDPAIQTLIMTGRHAGLRSQVIRILKDGDLFEENLDIRFLGDDGPITTCRGKPSATLDWKLWILDQYTLILPNLETIEIWEDRPEHVEAFRNWQTGVEVIVHAVP